MADLHADLGLAFGMDEIGDPLPGSLVFRGIEPRTTRRDPAFGETQVISV
jgi:hypothetical protein